MIASESQKRLFEAARKILDNAYSPYSNIKVAASLLDDRGRIFTGVNVENASYGLTICAERNAIAAAVSSGMKSITALLITSSIGKIPPCGACRQVIAEFSSPSTQIFLADGEKIVEETTIGELFPMAFELKGDE